MTTRLPALIYADLIGKPFLPGGRGPDGYDCLGACMVLQRRLGFAIPEYASTLEELHRHYAAGQGILGPCRQIAGAWPGAVVLMRSLGGPAAVHMGTMTDTFRMVHASQPAGQVVKETLRTSHWGKRVIGYYMPEVRA